MSKLEYGCNVSNQFEEIPDDVPDPFELLLKEQSASKDKQQRKTAVEHLAGASDSRKSKIKQRDNADQPTADPQRSPTQSSDTQASNFSAQSIKHDKKSHLNASKGPVALSDNNQSWTAVDDLRMQSATQQDTQASHDNDGFQATSISTPEMSAQDKLNQSSPEHREFTTSSQRPYRGNPNVGRGSGRGGEPRDNRGRSSGNYPRRPRGDFDGNRSEGRKFESTDMDHSNATNDGFGFRVFRRGGRAGHYDSGSGPRRGRFGQANRNRGSGVFSGGNEQIPAYNQDMTEFVEADSYSLPAIETLDEHNDERPTVRRGRGRGYGGAGSFGGDRGKRQFDRHSGRVGSSVRAGEKRHGTGAHNWGDALKSEFDGDYKQLQEGALESNEQSQEPESQSSQGPETAEPAGDNLEENAREVEPVKMTLDEYREQQRQLRPVLGERKALRQAGEGEDLKRWGRHTQAYRKKPEESSKYQISTFSPLSTTHSEDEEEAEDKLDPSEAKARELMQNLFVGKSGDRYDNSQRPRRGGAKPYQNSLDRETFGNSGRGGRAEYRFRSNRGAYDEDREGNRRGRPGAFNAGGRGRGNRPTNDAGESQSRDYRPYRQNDAQSHHRNSVIPPPDMSDFPELV